MNAHLSALRLAKMQLTVPLRAGGVLAIMALVGGCASNNAQRTDTPSSANQAAATAPAPTAANTAGGRYALTGDAYPIEPPDVAKVPDAEPRIEQPSAGGNRSTYEVWGKTYHVLPDATGYERRGTASWYGEKFHGYATSNGEIYDMYKMSAAHRSLPLPTYARVTSLDSGQSIIVRVNDRGPFHSDREIDLSYAAAARLGFLDNGTGPVKVEAIDSERWVAERGGATPERAVSQVPATRPSPSVATQQPAAPVPAAPVQTAVAQAPSAPTTAGDSSGAMYLQIAALGSPEGAQQLQQRLEGEQPHSVRIMNDADMYRVQVGPIAPAQESQAREALRQAGFPQVFVVR